MSDRFIIDCYGIIDTWKPTTGKCEDDKLSWSELCETLNELDQLATERWGGDYRVLHSTLKENKELKFKLQKCKETMKQLEEMLWDVKR